MYFLSSGVKGLNSCELQSPHCLPLPIGSRRLDFRDEAPEAEPFMELDGLLQASGGSSYLSSSSSATGAVLFCFIFFFFFFFFFFFISPSSPMAVEDPTPWTISLSSSPLPSLSSRATWNGSCSPFGMLLATFVCWWYKKTSDIISNCQP